MAGLFTSLLLHAGINEILTPWVWMGGTDLVKMRDFVWTDGTHLPLNAAVWLPGEPNNDIEHCLHIFTEVYRLNDIICDFVMPYLCQIDM